MDEFTFTPLASGSKGNSLLVRKNDTGILVDAGISASEIEKRITAAGIDSAVIKAIVITHEHLDHIKGAAAAARKFRVPIYINDPTLRGSMRIWQPPPDEIILFSTGRTFRIGDLEIETFLLPHDAAEPAGLCIQADGLRIGIATDLGSPTRLVQERLKTCHAVVLEANHDRRMLIAGPYPWHLKQRISSKLGHLSNDSSASLIESIIHRDLRYIVLAHLSEINNTTEAALLAVHKALMAAGADFVRVTVAHQHRVGETIVLSKNKEPGVNDKKRRQRGIFTLD